MDDRTTIDAAGAGRGFRITAGVLGALLVVLTVPFAIIAIVSSDPTQTIHRFHTTGGAVPSLILVAALFVLAWRPGDVAAMQLLAAAAVVTAAVGILAGDLFTGLLFIGLVIVAILLALYPARSEVWRLSRPRLSLLVAAVVAAIPAIAYALAQAALQRHALPGDPHGDAHHYSGAAVAGVALPTTVLVAAVGGVGWRVVGWIAGVALVVFGVSSLVYSTYVSAPDTAWAWACVAAGVVVLALAEVEARRDPGARSA